MHNVVRGPIGISVLLLLASLVAAATPALAEGTNTFTWQSAADRTGPGAYRVVVDVGSSNDCILTVEGTAALNGGPGLWVRLGGSWGMFSTGEAAQIHANGIGVDTRTGASGNGGMRFSTSGLLSGQWALSVIAPDLDPWLVNEPDPWYPARFDVACVDPVTVLGFSGSREVVAFSDQTMQGTGAGASALLAGAAVSVGDQAGGSFASESVEVYIADWVFNGVDVYDWTLEAGDATITNSGTLPPADFEYVGGSGDYTFTLTRVAAGMFAQLSGWMVGYSSVASLDDI